jgi:hypothetical protein
MKRKRPTRAEREERDARHKRVSRVSEEAARAASSALAMVDTAERLLDRDLEASDDAGVAASRE